MRASFDLFLFPHRGLVIYIQIDVKLLMLANYTSDAALLRGLELTREARVVGRACNWQLRMNGFQLDWRIDSLRCRRVGGAREKCIIRRANGR